MKKILFSAFLAVLLSSVLPAASKTFDMYVIDVEGGKSLLLVSPSGESMLIDTGFPGNDDRDAKRIAEAVKAANLKQVDRLVTSHYDGDHVANLAPTAAQVNVVIRDDAGAQIGTGSITLPAQGHNSFMLTDSNYGFPATAAMRGTVEFDTPKGKMIFRKEDHQALQSMYHFKVKVDPNVAWAVLEPVRELKIEDMNVPIRNKR